MNSHQIIDDIDQLTLGEARELLRRLKNLHPKGYVYLPARSADVKWNPETDRRDLCELCRQYWPCETIRLIQETVVEEGDRTGAQEGLGPRNGRDFNA